ncbi:MAG: hypothetical protein ACPHYD_03950, partial [Porticoccaceae bacterium]
MHFYLKILNFKALALLLLFTSSYALSDQSYKSVGNASEYTNNTVAFDYDASSIDVLDKRKTSNSHKHHRDMKWSEHVREARSYFRMRLREFFQYLRRIRAAIKDPDTDWDNFDWSYSGGNDSSGDDSTGDDSTGDDSTGDDSTGD